MRARLPSVIAATLLGVVASRGAATPALGTPGADAQILPVSVTTDVATNFGDQYVVLSGWVELNSSEPRLEGGREVVDVQIAQLYLTGASQLGRLTVSARDDGAHVSRGELRSLQPEGQFPASSFLDLYVAISAPDSPAGPLVLYNDVALRLVPQRAGSEVFLAAWPPLGVAYAKPADQPCVPLLDKAGVAVKLGVCVAGLNVNIAPLLPAFSVGRSGPSRLHPADLLGLIPAGSTLSGQAPIVRIPCASLGLTADGCDDGSDGTQDDVDALSFGQDMPGHGPPWVFFSVAPGAQGAPGSAVEQQHNCPPAQPGAAPEPESDVFSASLDGSNQSFFDGNGPIGSCASAFPLGLIEAATARDSVDAIDARDASAVDPDGDGVPERPVYFSLDADSPSLQAYGFTAGDVLATVDGQPPAIFAPASQLGLRAGDEIAALCLQESGDGAYAAGDVVYFVLTPRSPSLAAVGAGPGDVLSPGKPLAVAARGSSLGLAGTDALAGLACEAALSPPGASGDVNCDGAVNETDAQLVLQFEAHLIRALPCPNAGDASRDGVLNSIDAMLILQFNAGLIGRLPR